MLKCEQMLLWDGVEWSRLFHPDRNDFATSAYNCQFSWHAGHEGGDKSDEERNPLRYVAFCVCVIFWESVKHEHERKAKKKKVVNYTTKPCTSHPYVKLTHSPWNYQQS